MTMDDDALHLSIEPSPPISANAKRSIEKARREALQASVDVGWENEGIKEIGKIKQKIRAKVGEFLNKETDREPIILPIIMEV